MLPLAGVFAFYFALVGVAAAEWQSGSGEDPMTDQKWMTASAGFSEIGLPQVVFKCWAGGHLQLGIIVGQYEDAASYATAIPVKFRVDKDEPVDIVAEPAKLDRMLMLAVTGEHEPKLITLLKSIGQSKQRIAFSVGERCTRRMRVAAPRLCKRC